jgi:serine/threonine protein kinase
VLTPSHLQETGSTLIRASELEYRRDDEIARGNYGTVYKGRCRGFPVAIKVLHNQQLTQQKIEELKREVEIMKYAIPGPNIETRSCSIGFCLNAPSHVSSFPESLQ